MTPTEEKVVQTLREIFRAKGETPPPLSESSPVDHSLGLDSLDFAELAVRLEDQYGRDPFSEGEVPPLRTVADLAKLYE